MLNIISLKSNILLLLNVSCKLRLVGNFVEHMPVPHQITHIKNGNGNTQELGHLIIIIKSQISCGVVVLPSQFQNWKTRQDRNFLLAFERFIFARSSAVLKAQLINPDAILFVQFYIKERWRRSAWMANWTPKNENFQL